MQMLTCFCLLHWTIKDSNWSATVAVRYLEWPYLPFLHNPPIRAILFFKLGCVFKSHQERQHQGYQWAFWVRILLREEFRGGGWLVLIWFTSHEYGRWIALTWFDCLCQNSMKKVGGRPLDSKSCHLCPGMAGCGSRETLPVFAVFLSFLRIPWLGFPECGADI